MPIVAVIVGLALLYLWLAGHWFGRVLAFVAWCAVAMLFAAAFGDGRGVVSLPLLFGGCVGAWFLAKAPSAYWQKKAAEDWRAV